MFPTNFLVSLKCNLDVLITQDRPSRTAWTDEDQLAKAPVIWELQLPIYLSKNRTYSSARLVTRGGQSIARTQSLTRIALRKPNRTHLRQDLSRTSRDHPAATRGVAGGGLKVKMALPQSLRRPPIKPFYPY